MRLLLAEDERSLARALTVLLRKNNYEVDAVYDGEEAMAYLGSGNYDGAILDIMMPKRDGIDVLCQLRRQGNRELGIDNPIRNAQSDDGNQRGKHQCDHQRTNSNRSRRGGRRAVGRITPLHHRQRVGHCPGAGFIEQGDPKLVDRAVACPQID